MGTAVTVMIPAYRCDSSIARSLAGLAAQRLDAGPTPHLIVAVNDGCTASLDAARRHAAAVMQAGWRVDVIATPPGRRAAIAAAEALARPGAWLYLDQDAALTPGALAAFATAAADDGPARFLTFALSFTRSHSALVRRFLSVWLALPYVERSPVVAGAFGVSRAGRERWDALPPLASDDKYVRLRFAPHERLRLAGERYEVLADDDYMALVRARARYIRGNRQLARDLSATLVEDAPRHAGVAALLRSPRRWPDALVLATTTLLAQVLALRR